MKPTHYVLALVLALALFAGGSAVSDRLMRPSPTEADTLAAHVLANRTIVDFGIMSDGTVAYSYLDAPVPEKFADDEVVALRTNSSYTRHVDTVVEDGEERQVLEARIYAQPAFAKDADGSWKYLEYATTTEVAWRNRPVPLAQRMTEYFVRSAYAASISPFAGAGDSYVIGNVQCSGPAPFEVCPCSAFSEARSATDGIATSTTGTTFGVLALGEDYFDVDQFNQCNATFYRSFVPFDTSAIPAGATITAATLNLYATSKVNDYNDGDDYVTVVRTSQVSHTGLLYADYDQCGAVDSPTEGVDSGERKDITSVSTGAYLTFTLNATGRSWVAKSGQSSNCSATTGITCLGLREGHDVEGSFMSSPGQQSNIFFSASEQTGTSQDPYLSVTYSTGSFAFWMWSDF